MHTRQQKFCIPPKCIPPSRQVSLSQHDMDVDISSTTDYDIHRISIHDKSTCKKLNDLSIGVSFALIGVLLAELFVFKCRSMLCRRRQSISYRECGRHWVLLYESLPREIIYRLEVVACRLDWYFRRYRSLSDQNSADISLSLPCQYIRIPQWIITALGQSHVLLIVEYMLREGAAIEGWIRLGTMTNWRYVLGVGWPISDDFRAHI